MAKKNQSKRLTRQHKKTHGVIGIFGDEAKSHDAEVADSSLQMLGRDLFKQLSGRGGK